uniref:Uncharacterized protein n=1 Tax=Arundo donax TaxID=35708 RepID=A0A0A9F7X9_ARUDO
MASPGRAAYLVKLNHTKRRPLRPSELHLRPGTRRTRARVCIFFPAPLSH